MTTIKRKNHSLKRDLNFFSLSCYGIGTILGAGIYVLIGKIAGISGKFAPFSFLFASIIAGFTALSYAKLCKLYPKSGGEAEYVRNAFNKKWLSACIGWMIVFTGIVSASTLAKGFAGYFNIFFQINTQLIITALILSLTMLAIKGIKESVFLITIVTFIEVAGLCLVIYYGRDALIALPENWRSLTPALSDFSSWHAIFLASFIAFYAYIGFEDMVNVAEEVKNPEKTLPKAIILSLSISTIFYLLIAIIAVSLLTPGELNESDAPLALLLSSKSSYGKEIISFIGLIAILNGALVQIIMGSRLLYNLGQNHEAPLILSRIHHITRTPIYATIFMSILILILALWLPIETLAKSTSFIILSVFTIINISLITIQKRNHEKPNLYSYLGAITSFTLLCIQIQNTFF